MKKYFTPDKLPVTTVKLGSIALALRLMLYAFAVDEKNLLLENHPLELALYFLTAAVLAALFFALRKLDGSGEYEDNFAASKAAMLGHMAFAAGIALTLLTNPPAIYGYLGDLWRLLGYVSPVCLVLAGLTRGRGKRPFFLLHLVPCLFLVLHIVNHYQQWCGNPQLQDYVFMLFGTMALMLFAFYTAAFAVGSGQRRMQLFMGLAAVYLLLAELSTSRYPWLYLGGILWVLTGLCSLTPVPKREPEQDSGEEGESHVSA